MRRRAAAKHTAPAARPSTRAADGVQLAWARDRDGAKVRAARLDPADRRTRAPFTCLGCGEELVPHLGKRARPPLRAPARLRLPAHRAGDRPPPRREGAAPRALRRRLRAAAVRRARHPLPRPAGGPSRATSAALGDAAVAEGAVGALRADVLVTASGRPALALEVKVTHALGPEKEASLAAAGVPAVEIDARSEWERDGAGGASGSAAPARSASGSAPRARRRRAPARIASAAARRQRWPSSRATARAGSSAPRQGRRFRSRP